MIEIDLSGLTGKIEMKIPVLFKAPKFLLSEGATKDKDVAFLMAISCLANAGCSIPEKNLAHKTGKSQSAYGMLLYNLDVHNLDEIISKSDIKDKFNKLIANLPQSRNLAALFAASWLNYELMQDNNG